ncbi:hypothetical protein U9M48_011438 [Paspalum notatum var. saurae]|uniref:F-box protein AT5G49610-like beta-propeller domain-containing protein n=1 Tax=Paspalum notatum var. saurae TaxID=547442 RepID=A0AAQ3WHL8_PASNO
MMIRPSSMPPPPSLMDELVEEVLLRLPPDTPASLVHAVLVCKRWCRFRRRFHEFHHHRSSPPLTLGFLFSYRSAGEGRNTSFVPTPASPLRGADHRHAFAMAASSSTATITLPLPPAASSSGTPATSVIALPWAQTSLPFTLFGPTELTTTEDGRLAFARVEKSRLCLWSRDGAGWALSKAIDLEKVLPVQRPWTTRPYLVGTRTPYLVGSAAEGVGAVFLTLEDQLFMLDLRSGRATKLYGHPRTASLDMVVPYMNFFTPVPVKAPSTDGTPGASASDP